MRKGLKLRHDRLLMGMTGYQAGYLAQTGGRGSKTDVPWLCSALAKEPQPLESKLSISYKVCGPLPCMTAATGYLTTVRN